MKKLLLTFTVALLIGELCAAHSGAQEGRPLSSAMRSTEAVQNVLRSSEKKPQLKISGEWDAETNEAVRSFIQSLEGQPLWGRAWQGPKTGVYSTEFASFLRGAIKEARMEHVEPEKADRLAGFATAMDSLSRSGVYDAAAQDEQTKTSEEPAADGQNDSPENRVFLEPLLFWFANGALSGFADEIYCAGFHWATFDQCHIDAKTQIEQFDESHHYFAMAVNFVGASLNVISVMLSLVAIESDWTGALVMGLSFFMGIVDCFLYAAGDAWTATQSFSVEKIFQQFDAEMGPLIIMGLLSGFVMMWVVASHRWKHKLPPIGHLNTFERFWA